MKEQYFNNFVDALIEAGFAANDNESGAYIVLKPTNYLNDWFYVSETESGINGQIVLAVSASSEFAKRIVDLDESEVVEYAIQTAQKPFGKLWDRIDDEQIDEMKVQATQAADAADKAALQQRINEKFGEFY